MNFQFGYSSYHKIKVLIITTTNNVKTPTIFTTKKSYKLHDCEYNYFYFNNIIDK